MLLTLNVNSIRDKLSPRGKKKPLEVVDVPQHASQELGLHGLTLHTGLLAGATRKVLEQLRDRGDKTGCACLVLTETEPLGFGEAGDDAGEAAVGRMLKVVQAGSVLGCSSVALSIKARADDVAFERVVERMRRVSELAERLEVNVLIAPHAGLTADPDQCTALIKKIGGFRVGTLPDFQTAVGTDDPAGYLRRLTPFASAVNATTVKFEDPLPEDEPAKDEKKADDKAKDEPDEPLSGEEALLAELESMFDEPPPPVHVTYDLEPLVGAVTAVGYDQTLAIDYRGVGDSTLGVTQSRDALEAALEAVAQ
ncbi:MAG: TIM barrel protein [Phycisphaerales bacterium]